MDFTDASTIDVIGMAWAMNNALLDFDVRSPSRRTVAVRDSLERHLSYAVDVLRLRAEHGDREALEFVRELANA